ncbi:MAG: insulinase family protein [Planctomycetes bacterium]|nr:insulinase family protein [Planctomycetota bacterium]MBT6453003.1 insulinase family protein [Planctomycetota bacterium]MBT6541842.1 insulinase family protein [Planctomycetota bacterium]MBT6783507.1 insulinase family protein [Planctomycetota bacterium]MBT6968837.1 insulinase family protein [Planctomycetota bacterium]
MTGAATPSGSDFESSEISPGASLHIRQESRRKTSRLRVSWIHNMGPDAAQKCLVPSCLLRGSRSFPSLREISRRSEELWGLGIGGSIDRAGQLLIVTINAEFAEDSRLPGGEAVLADAVEFIREVILQPHLVEGCFDEDTVSSEVSQHRRSIEGRFDDKRSWAMQRCIEETCHDEPWRFHEYGTIESLDQATAESVTADWKKSIGSAPMHVHFSGEARSDSLTEILLPLFDGHDQQTATLADRFPLKGAGEVRELEEHFHGQQANLVISFRTSTGHGDPLQESMMIASGVIGGFPHSRLFTQVREKQSLCYSVNSLFDGSSGLMLVNAGIDGDTATRTRESILEQIDVVKRGEFSAEEFQMTLDAWDSRLRMTQDSPASLAEFDLVSRLVGRDPTIDGLRERVSCVTREGVIEAANRLETDLIYLLSPEDDQREDVQ